MQPDERVVHGKELAPDFFRVLWKLFARHHPGRSSARKRPGHKSVSVVTRTAYGKEQFSRLNGARINRDAGHPGHGIKPRGH